MNSAFSRMMQLREQQDRGEFVVKTTEYREQRDEPKTQAPKQAAKQEECYSLSS